MRNAVSVVRLANACCEDLATVARMAGPLADDGSAAAREVAASVVDAAVGEAVEAVAASAVLLVGIDETEGTTTLDEAWVCDENVSADEPTALFPATVDALATPEASGSAEETAARDDDAVALVADAGAATDEPCTLDCDEDGDGTGDTCALLATLLSRMPLAGRAVAAA